MPHVTVKMYAGRSEQQKAELTDEIVKNLMTTLKCSADAISVGIEDVAPENWAKDVYQPDIRNRWNTLTKKPGYTPQ